MLYIRTEVRFYQETMPLLIKKGFHAAPKIHLAQHNLDAWIPDDEGHLRRPEEVLFDSLGWKPSPFVVSKIRFKPTVVLQLAQEVGIEPEVLDLLKKIGVKPGHAFS